MKHPSYVVLGNACKEEPLAYQVTSLAYNVVDLIQKDPQQAKVLAKALMIVGIFGAGIWIITQLLN
jgi:hypothetical protein